MTTSHTPGPWSLRVRHTSKEGEHYELTAIEGRLRGMAYIYSGDEDAHVMNAAPDLLEALEALVEYVDEMHRIGHIQRPVQSSNAVAAIAKARGGK